MILSEITKKKKFNNINYIDMHDYKKGPIVKDWAFYNKTNECMSAAAPIGMGNAQPPSSAGMSWSQQTTNNVGSGDRWDNKAQSNKKRTKVKVKNVKRQDEAANVSPYDKLGNIMLDKLKIPKLFDETKDGGVISKTEKRHRISSLK